MADHAAKNGNYSDSSTGLRLKVGLAEMLKGGVIMDVMNVEQAKIAERPEPSPSSPLSVSRR